jgi:hypothetical protein
VGWLGGLNTIPPPRGQRNIYFWRHIFMKATLYTDIQAPLDFEGMTKEEYLKIIQECDVGREIESGGVELKGMTAEQIFQHYLLEGFIVEVES